ncbi:MAG: uroporphyrinogen-III C-methyltransferase [Candidatus Dormiibacterota bacterium]
MAVDSEDKAAPYYPVFLDLRERPCVVFGGGPLAYQKIRGLLDSGASVKVITAEPSAEVQGLANASRVELVLRASRPGDLAGALLAIDASEDDKTHRELWDEANRTGTLINVVDRPTQCHFIAPAVVRRDPLIIAISTSGQSPHLASALRSRLERQFGTEWGPFTALVGGIRRRLRAEGLTLEQQTRIYQRLLRSSVRDELRSGHSDAARQVADEIARQTVGTGRVSLVGAGPGGERLLTAAARDLLESAEYVLWDALVPPEVLRVCGPQVQLEAVGRRGGRPGQDQSVTTARIIDLARRGHDVVRLKGGDPFVFGRGGEEVAALAAAGVAVTVVPGVSAATGVATAAGIPLTMRGIASSFTVLTGSQQDGQVPDRLEILAAAADTLVVLMPLGNLEQIAIRVGRAIGEDRPAALVGSGTLQEQVVVRAPIGQIWAAVMKTPVEPPATLIVGSVVQALIPGTLQGTGQSG